MKRAVFFFAFIVGVMAVAPPASADPFTLVRHSDIKRNWAGTEARLNILSPPSGVTGWIDHHNTNAVSTTGMVDVSGQNDPAYRWTVQGYSTVAPYDSSGGLIATGRAEPGGPTAGATAGGYFRDEIYFTSPGALSGFLEFDFAVSYALVALQEQAAASFKLEVWKGAAGTGTLLARYFDPIFWGGEGATNLKQFDGRITLSTRDLGYVLESGGYFPFTFVISTEAWNLGVLEWDIDRPYRLSYVGGMAPLSGVRVLDLDGNAYDPTNYALYSTEPPVPEPASLFLFGSGLLGLGAWRKRRR